MNLNDPISTIMTTNITSVSPSQKLLDVKHIFEKKKFHHHIPVIENEKLVGMVSLIDYMQVVRGASLDDEDAIYHNFFVKDIMSEHPNTKPSTTSIKKIAEELSKGEVRAIAIADDKKLKGIVSTADIIRHFLSFEK